MASKLHISRQRVDALHARLGLAPHRIRAAARLRPVKRRDRASYEAARIARAMERAILVRVVCGAHPDWTTRQVAAELGCSVGTVQRAMRGYSLATTVS